MQAVITGDIVNSREVNTAHWLPELKKRLQEISENWEIFRGDSFQLLVAAEKAILCAFLIKAAIRQIKPLDVRLAIGLGTVDYRAKEITQSNGSAFVFSGACFDTLKKRTLALKSHNEAFDEVMNLVLILTAKFADEWTEAAAQAIETALCFPEDNQKQWAERMNKSQSTVNEALKRAGFDEIKQVLHYYNHQIQSL